MPGPDSRVFYFCCQPAFFVKESNMRKRKIAEYMATFCVNTASIGAGIAIFGENRLPTAILAVGTLLSGLISLWRAYK